MHWLTDGSTSNRSAPQMGSTVPNGPGLKQMGVSNSTTDNNSGCDSRDIKGHPPPPVAKGSKTSNRDLIKSSSKRKVMMRGTEGESRQNHPQNGPRNQADGSSCSSSEASTSSVLLVCYLLFCILNDCPRNTASERIYNCLNRDSLPDKFLNQCHI